MPAMVDPSAPHGQGSGQTTDGSLGNSNPARSERGCDQSAPAGLRHARPAQVGPGGRRAVGPWGAVTVASPPGLMPARPVSGDRPAPGKWRFKIGGEGGSSGALADSSFLPLYSVTATGGGVDAAIRYIGASPASPSWHRQAYRRGVSASTSARGRLSLRGRAGRLSRSTWISGWRAHTMRT